MRLKSAATGRGAPRASGSEATPIVVNGVMYLPAAGRVVALEPETGKELWRYELPAGSPSNRGVTYWPGDQNNPPRIIFTTGHMMMALNAKTGKVDPGFGKEGAGGSGGPLQLAADRLQEHAVRGRQRAGDQCAGPAGRHPRLRCPHRREAVGVPLRAARRRAGQ